jgi:hypothetical protein
MTSRQIKKQMLDYLVDKLQGSAPVITPTESEIVSGIKTRYISLFKVWNTLESDTVILIDTVYPRDSFARVYSIVREQSKGKVTPIILKDGENFFKNSAESHGFKQRYGLSLKHYTPSQINRMITFRPEELFIYEKKDGWLQYYQPKSEKLNESVVTMKFRPVHFNYDHIDKRGLAYELHNTDSKEIRIWSEEDKNISKERAENSGPLMIGEFNGKNYLLKRH